MMNNRLFVNAATTAAAFSSSSTLLLRSGGGKNSARRTTTFGISHSYYSSSSSPPSSTRLYGKSNKGKTNDNNKLYRADRVLSNRGMGSRSECFDLLKQKRVFIRNDSNNNNNNDDDVFTRVQGPSTKLSMTASLWIDKRVQVPKPLPLLRVYHKPKWVLSVMNDNKGRKNVGQLDFLSNNNKGSSSNNKMHPVGRLDYDTSGLLLFSSDGKLTQTLLHPNHEIEKEYVALVVGKIGDDDGNNGDNKTKEELKETLERGVSTSLGVFPAKLLDVKSIPSEQVPIVISNIINNLPDEYDITKLDEKGYLFFKNATDLSEIRLVVQEGMYLFFKYFVYSLSIGI